MARFELHVWGGAFGLESIDFECLAAIKYCTQTFHRTGLADQWKIIPSSDPSVCPSQQLPALLHNGVWTSGYRRIAKYLGHHLELADTLTPTQRADALAYETYLTSRLTTLLDLSLYASATNWAATTRPAYSSILHFPLTWTVPPTLRAQAVRRVERFGFSDLDADGRGDEEEEEEAPAFRWKGLLGRRRVVDAMSAEQMMGIRLYSFARDTLEEVQEGIGKVVFVEGEVEEEGLSRTTWLLYACLALMVVPDVPQAWLRTLLHSEFPNLVRLYEKVRDSGSEKATTTVVAPYEVSASSTTRRFFHHVIGAVPTLGDTYTREWRRLASMNASSLDTRSSALFSAALFVAPALTYGYQVWRGLPPWGRPSHVWTVGLKNARGLGRYGEIGAMLDFTANAAGESATLVV